MSPKPSSRDALLDATFLHVYRHGYHGAATATILREAGVPKGSMYHHFASKQAMVLAMIEERLAPKMQAFYAFDTPPDGDVRAILQHTFETMSQNTPLMTYGCPLHRLMQETRAQNEPIYTACTTIYDDLRTRLAHLLASEHKDPTTLAEHIILTTWGLLSRPLDDAPEKAFLEGTKDLINTYL
jgi:TetR/AcrR family transcriptional repressor of nem operon